MLKRGLRPKAGTIVNFVGAVCEHAVDGRLRRQSPPRPATKRRRGGDVEPDLHFLSLEQLEAVIRAIPDEIVYREPRRFAAAGAARPLPAARTSSARCCA